MNAPPLCRDIKAGLGALFDCAEKGDILRVRTPFLYPDGDVIDLFCKQEDDVLTVSDFGETSRWLRMQTVSARRSAKQQALILDICVNHGVEFYKGMLQARVRPGEDLSAVVIRVAQATLRVADLWFTFRTRSVQSTSDEVSDFLLEQGMSFERDEKLVGRSGRSWTVDFHVRTPARSSLVYVLTTGNRSAARRIVEHVLAGWYDLNYLVAGPEALRFISLFDDTVDVWSDEDFSLLAELSTTARWSKPDEFAKELRAA